MDEVLLIDKPAGMTSFGVVARLRRVLSQAAGKKVKVGHTGTLDPFATGLMIIVTGKKCREADTFTKLDKWYEAEIMLGEISTTGDPEGELTRVSARQPSRSEVEAVLSIFEGEIKQRPPIFSAIKINGRRAYQLARQGQPVDMPERTVSIYALELVAYEYPRLGTGAYCHQLRRQAIAEYDVAQAKPLADFGISS